MMAYHVPLQSIQDIILFFNKDIGMDVTANDFKNPDPRRIMDIYAAMFELITNKSIEQSIQAVIGFDSGPDSIEHYDLYEEGINQMIFTIYMHRVMYACCFHDFSIKDVIDPTPKRLIRIASYVMNYLSHQSVRYQVTAEMKESMVKLIMDYDKATALNNQVKGQLAKTREILEQKENLLAESNEKGESLNLKRTEKQSEGEAARRVADEIKLKCNEKIAHKEKLKGSITAAQQENEKLSQKIVSSPERFKQEQERLKNDQQELTAERASKLQKLTQEKAFKDQSHNYIEAAEKMSKLTIDVQCELDKINSLNGEFKASGEKFQELQTVYYALCARVQDMEEKQEFFQECKRKHLAQMNVKQQSTHQALVLNKENREKYEEEIDKIQADIQQKRTEIRLMTDEINNHESSFKDRIAAWESQFLEKYQVIDILHSHLAQGFKNFRELGKESV